jgi:hypothetical protein
MANTSIVCNCPMNPFRSNELSCIVKVILAQCQMTSWRCYIRPDVRSPRFRFLRELRRGVTASGLPPDSHLAETYRAFLISPTLSRMSTGVLAARPMVPPRRARADSAVSLQELHGAVRWVVGLAFRDGAVGGLQTLPGIRRSSAGMRAFYWGLARLSLRSEGEAMMEGALRVGQGGVQRPAQQGFPDTRWFAVVSR